MRRAFNGETFGREIVCSNFEELQKVVANSDWFKTDNMDWYYKSIPFEKNGKYDTQNVVKLRAKCATSANTYTTYFYKISASEKAGKVYFGKSLEEKIFSELRLWAKNLTPKMTAFSGRKFLSYLNAIPSEIYTKPGFYDKMYEAVFGAFTERINEVNGNKTQLRDVSEIVKSARTMMDEKYIEKVDEENKIYDETKAVLEEIKEKKQETKTIENEDKTEIKDKPADKKEKDVELTL